MTVKATQFRQNLFRYLDECRDTGMAVIIERGGDRFRLEAEGTRKPVGSAEPRPLLTVLQRDYFLSVDESGWLRAAEAGSTLGWTRDLFDRLITAHALIWGAPLLTRDRNIRDHYRHAFWDAPP